MTFGDFMKFASLANLVRSNGNFQALLPGPAVIDFQPNPGSLTLIGRAAPVAQGGLGAANADYTTVTNTDSNIFGTYRFDVLYLNTAGQDNTFAVNIGNSGTSFVIYQSESGAQNSNVSFDVSGSGATFTLNGRPVPAVGGRVTLYSGNRAHWYRVVCSEDGDQFDVFDEADGGLSAVFVAAAAGTSTTIDGTGLVVLKPAATIATHTLVYPPHPLDGDAFTFTSTQIITALTNSSGTNSRVGAPTTLAANSYATMKYCRSDTTWYRVG